MNPSLQKAVAQGLEKTEWGKSPEGQKFLDEFRGPADHVKVNETV